MYYIIYIVLQCLLKKQSELKATEAISWTPYKRNKDNGKYNSPEHPSERLRSFRHILSVRHLTEKIVRDTAAAQANLCAVPLQQLHWISL